VPLGRDGLKKIPNRLAIAGHEHKIVRQPHKHWQYGDLRFPKGVGEFSTSSTKWGGGLCSVGGKACA